MPSKSKTGTCAVCGGKIVGARYSIVDRVRGKTVVTYPLCSEHGSEVMMTFDELREEFSDDREMTDEEKDEALRTISLIKRDTYNLSRPYTIVIRELVKVIRYFAEELDC